MLSEHHPQITRKFMLKSQITFLFGLWISTFLQYANLLHDFLIYLDIKLKFSNALFINKKRLFS